jgi:hypothetical protein
MRACGPGLTGKLGTPSAGTEPPYTDLWMARTPAERAAISRGMKRRWAERRADLEAAGRYLQQALKWNDYADGRDIVLANLEDAASYLNGIPELQRPILEVLADEAPGRHALLTERLGAKSLTGTAVHRDFPARVKARGDGQVVAIVSVFGNVDLGGDRVAQVLPGEQYRAEKNSRFLVRALRFEAGENP